MNVIAQPAFEWTDDRVERLRELFGRGDSHRVIAKDFGISQGVIARKLKKLGLLRPETAPQISGGRKATDVEPPAITTVSLLAARDDQCRFPLWDDNGAPDFPVCGAKCDLMHAYCPTHTRRAFTRSEPRRDREKVDAEAARAFARVGMR